LPPSARLRRCKLTRRPHPRRRSPTSARIARARTALLVWFRRNGRRFPWRDPHADNYVHVLTEVLLQRTRAEVVAGFLPAFLTRFPCWASVAAARRGVLERRLIKLGLWRRRGSSLRNLARELGARDWRWPSTRCDLEQMPAVGQYVAGAVLLFVHGRPEPLLDTNMARVLERLYGSRELADIRYDPWLQKLAHRLVRSRAAREVNWAVFDLAALVCRTRAPLCNCCPVSSMCDARRAGRKAPPRRG
jgi:A/G-specific adenine glycosylase